MKNFSGFFFVFFLIVILDFCSDPFYHTTHKNDTNLKKKKPFFIFFKTMGGTFCVASITAVSLCYLFVDSSNLCAQISDGR